MPDLPFMPLAVESWDADTGHLTDAEDGIYGRLVRMMWKMPSQRIPNDDAWLARRMRRGVNDVVRDVRPIIAEFFQTDGNWITHKRVSSEWIRSSKVSAQRSDAAKSRWNKGKISCGSNAAPHVSRNAPIPIPIPIKKKKEESPPETFGLSAPLGSDGFAEFYAAYPRRVGRGAAIRAYQAALKKTEPSVLLAAAKAAATKFSDSDPQFIPHPATWLNGERWLDENAQPPPPSKPAWNF